LNGTVNTTSSELVHADGSRTVVLLQSMASIDGIFVPCADQGKGE